jgi:deoxycytidylate deaminase
MVPDYKDKVHDVVAMSRRGHSPVVRGERVEEVFASICGDGLVGDGGYRHCGQHDLRGAYNTHHLETCRGVHADQDLLVLAHRHRHCNSAANIATVA